jgi:hypothetical protein
VLSGNLASRPFYSERLASTAVGLIGVVALLLTGFNLWRITVLSSERSAVRARLAADVRETERISGEAAALRRAVDRPTLARLASSAKEANSLIDQRTFSWTTLFGLLEKTLPFDVRLVAVTPRVERETFIVAMSIVARDFEHVDEFIEGLEGTGAFYDVAPTDQQRNEDGTYGALVEAAYIPPVLVPAKPASLLPTTTPPTAAPASAAPGGPR